MPLRRAWFGLAACCATLLLGNAGCSGSVHIGNDGSPPSIASLSPSRRYQSQPGFTLTVTGSNFQSASVVNWNGSPRTTTLAAGSTTQLFAQIPASDLQNAGTAQVTVVNPAGGGTSSAAVFTILAPPPGGFPLLQSVATGGAPGNNESTTPAMSADGRFVVFHSLANNFVSGLNGGEIFVHDNCLGAPANCAPSTILASRANDGSVPNLANSSVPAISADGRYVAFRSGATNLVANDTNLFDDAFLRDTCQGPAAPANCTPSTIRVSVSSTGAQALGDSGFPSASRDGRFIAFFSAASNLAPNDTNTMPDIFIRDTCLGPTAPVNCSPSTTLVSADNNGNIGNALSTQPSVSSDGRYVAFQSLATNLAGTIPFNSSNVFLRDTCLGPSAPANCMPSTILLSGTPGGGAVANSFSGFPSISSDGRFVVFHSNAVGLTAAATNGMQHIFLRDTCLGPTAPTGCAPATTLISADPAGAQGNSNSFVPFISSSGRFVGFSSDSTNLVMNDTNGHRDAFVRDTCFGAPPGCVPGTVRVSLSNSGAQGDGDSGASSRSTAPVYVSANGQFAVFSSEARNFVPVSPTSLVDIYLALTPF